MQWWHKQPADAAGGTAVHAGGQKEASKPPLSGMQELRDGGHKAQDPSATEGALTVVCCQTLVPRWRTQLSKSIGPQTLQSSPDYFHGRGEWKRLLKTGKEQISLLSSQRKVQGATGQ